jgi:hypothetical protein
MIRPRPLLERETRKEIYLRAFNPTQAMEAVRDFSYGVSVFEEDREEAHTGREHPCKSGY